jgi:hypothetical protein
MKDQRLVIADVVWRKLDMCVDARGTIYRLNLTSNGMWFWQTFGKADKWYLDGSPSVPARPFHKVVLHVLPAQVAPVVPEPEQMDLFGEEQRVFIKHLMRENP